MTSMISGLDGLRATLEGTVLTPGDAGYDEARTVWNEGIDHRPVVIAGCRSTADVVAAVGFAREHGLDISVRSGAHNTAGLAVADGGVMIDLRAMSAVVVDVAE
jgi:FAD/FMN-containing dehydrogenase